VDNAVVDENKVDLINNLADFAVAEAVANGLIQHPEHPQDSSLVSSGTQAFFRAQGAPITLELPLLEATSAGRVVTVPGHNVVRMQDDYSIRSLAAKFGLHQCFGPSPSVEILVQDLAQYAQTLQASLPMKEPLPTTSWNFVPASSDIDTWFLNMDNPSWGNNVEASSSSGARKPRLEFIRDSDVDSSDSSYMELGSPPPVSRDMVPYNQEFARKQILISIHGLESSPADSLGVLVQDMDLLSQQTTDHSTATPLVPDTRTPAPSRRRCGRAQTPIIDDEVRRSSRLKTGMVQEHIQLNNEPRRKKGASKKSVSISSVADLKKAIVSRSLEETLDEDEVAPIPTPLLVELGHSFCGIPLMELSPATLTPEDEVIQ
jgi:hypothetical protein